MEGAESAERPHRSERGNPPRAMIEVTTSGCFVMEHPEVVYKVPFRVPVMLTKRFSLRSSRRLW